MRDLELLHQVLVEGEPSVGVLRIGWVCLRDHAKSGAEGERVEERRLAVRDHGNVQHRAQLGDAGIAQRVDRDGVIAFRGESDARLEDGEFDQHLVVTADEVLRACLERLVVEGDLARELDLLHFGTPVVEAFLVEGKRHDDRCAWHGDPPSDSCRFVVAAGSRSLRLPYTGFSASQRA